MPCGCADKLNINNKKLTLSLETMNNVSIDEINTKYNLDKDKLSLDVMKGLSIDEIISLYRQGYVLEGTVVEGTEYETVSPSIPGIESMQTYSTSCTGNIDVDINWSSVNQQGGHYLYKESAKAFKINPTSRCLEFITFYGIRRIADVSLYIEIREDDGTGNKPLGVPGNSTGQVAQVVVPYGNIPTTFGSFSVDFMLLLPAIGTYWLVLRSTDYSCVNAATQRLELSWHWLNENRRIIYGYSDLYCAPVSCCWYGLNVDVLPIATYKKTFNPPVLTTISVTPTTTSVNVGATTQLTAICKDQNNTTMTCPTLSWLSNNTSKATVNSSGLVTGVSAGTANITASGGGITSNISAVTITSPTPVLTTIEVSPTTPSINVGATQQLTVICRDQNTNTMTCPTLLWLSSNTSKATVNSSGLVTGVSAGTANITASAGGVTSNISAVTVTSPTPVLTTIAISPTTPSIGIGGIVVLDVICKDQNNSTMTCPTLTWISSNPAIATVAPTRLVTGVSPGSTNITASAGGVTSNISVVTVTGVVSTLTSIAISPTTTSIAPGDTKQFTVICKDQDANAMICPTLTWISSNPATATVNSTGLATGIAVGTTNITATAAGVISNIAAMTVTTTPPSAGTGGAMMIAAIAAIGIAYFMMKKPPIPK